MNPLSLGAVVQDDVKTAGDCNNELLESTVRMSSTMRSTWHVVEVVNALYMKINTDARFNVSEVPSVVDNTRQLDETAFGD